MPVHDWTRVGPGIFHHFHCAWIQTLSQALNNGVLPQGYYALTEQVAGEMVPDALALEKGSIDLEPTSLDSRGATLSVEESPPRTAVVAEGDEVDEYVRRQKFLSIRHSSDDRIIAMIEIVSRGNKQSRASLGRFVDKSVGALFSGVHLLIIDLIRPGRHDPRGIHGAIWDQLHGIPFEPPAGRPFTLAAYVARTLPKAYVEPLSLGDRLVDMPLFLTANEYVNTPLESTCEAAFAAVPERWRREICE